jgi:hypothetical protein
MTQCSWFPVCDEDWSCLDSALPFQVEWRCSVALHPALRSPQEDEIGRQGRIARVIFVLTVALRDCPGKETKAIVR